MKKGLFITSTDTGVGKTLITAAIAYTLKARNTDVVIMKPISTGSAANSDAKIYNKLLKGRIKIINPVHLKYPLSPYAASKLCKKQVSVGNIMREFYKLKNKFVLVEGIGGVYVPICKDYFIYDLIKKMNLETIIIARASLGTINHTLMTIDILKKNNIKVKGIILNGFKGRELSERTNAGIIKELSGCKVIAEIPWNISYRGNIKILADELIRQGYNRI